jgi:hypothetical protein
MQKGNKGEQGGGLDSCQGYRVEDTLLCVCSAWADGPAAVAVLAWLHAPGWAETKGERTPLSIFLICKGTMHSAWAYMCICIITYYELKNAILAPCVFFKYLYIVLTT